MVGPYSRPGNRLSSFVDALLTDGLRFHPVPPGMAATVKLEMPRRRVPVDLDDDTEQRAYAALRAGALPRAVAEEIVRGLEGDARAVASHLPGAGVPAGVLDGDHAAAGLAAAAVRVALLVHEALFDVEPLSELEFRLTRRAKRVLALGWEAMLRLGRFPTPPHGPERLQRIKSKPCGALHFVSASDLDRGYYYTLGIAQSPEAQALRSLELGFGLDGELIVPGQAVSPIPPLLALATRLFAAGVPTSSNISEEQHSIPARAFPRPVAYHDLDPLRPEQTGRGLATGNVLDAVDDVLAQLGRSDGRFDVDAVIDVTGLDRERADAMARGALAHPRVREARERVSELLRARDAGRDVRVALFVNVERTPDRGEATRRAIELAHAVGLGWVAVCSDREDPWLPGLNEYFTAAQLNALADYADERGVCVVDGRPVDPEYTAATACQRIQSVMSTLAVDVLKLGMWLCLDARTARRVWESIRAVPAFGAGMVLMPIGIVEPWSSFVDNRNPAQTGRAIEDPFRKITFMLEEAEALGMPSLLTDTRHKETWLLLGSKTGDLERHPREVGHQTPLLSWKEFMETERLARRKGVWLGQAGSVEMSQIFRVISETTFDAALEGRNPATAIWTAETERVLRRPGIAASAVGLQRERSADVSPFLAVVNRAEESHARLDGWLRFLEERARIDGASARSLQSLRTRLDDTRRAAQQALDALLAVVAASGDARRVRAAWRAYRTAFLQYHRLVRDNFATVRDGVEAAWAVLRRTGRRRAAGGKPRAASARLRRTRTGR